MSRTLKDLTGKKFGLWEVVERGQDKVYKLKNLDETPKHYKQVREVHWTCKCKCGFTKDVSSSSLLRGISRSCGKNGCKTEAKGKSRGKK